MLNTVGRRDAFRASRHNGGMTRRLALSLAAGAAAAALLLGLLVVLLPTAGIAAIDQGWNQLMGGLRQPWLLSFAYAMNIIGGGWVAIFLVPLTMAALLWALRGWRTAVFALISFAASALLVQVLKHLFARARPDDMLVSSDFGSFPSGHAANAATVAMVLWIVFPRVWAVIAGVAWVVLMALSRTLLSVHWLSDTIAGTLLGAGAALLVAVGCASWVRLAAFDTLARSSVDSSIPSTSQEFSVPRIRPYQPADRDALYEVCVRTADAGGDATGIFTDDALWGDVFAVPYAERHPDLSWVVESEDGRVIGYLVATDDTNAFESWFRDEWWPTKAAQYPLSGEAEPTRQDRIISYAAGRAPGKEPNAGEYPAHLHIDLLPETQGHGLGRTLMQTLFAELERRGVPALHLGMDPANIGAAAFYTKLGFEPLPAPEGAMTLGIRF